MCYVDSKEYPQKYRADIAEAYGIVAACIAGILESRIVFYIENRQNYFEGRTWLYHSVPAFNEKLPFTKASTIKRAIKGMVDGGLLLRGSIKGNNPNNTTSYAFLDEGMMFSYYLSNVKNIPIPYKFIGRENKETWSLQYDQKSNSNQKNVSVVVGSNSTSHPVQIEPSVGSNAPNHNKLTKNLKNNFLVTGEKVFSQNKYNEKENLEINDRTMSLETLTVEEKLTSTIRRVTPTELFRLICKSREKFNPSLLRLQKPSMPKEKDLGLCKYLLDLVPNITSYLDVLSEQWCLFGAMIREPEEVYVRSAYINLSFLVRYHEYIEAFSVETIEIMLAIYGRGRSEGEIIKAMLRSPILPLINGERMVKAAETNAEFFYNVAYNLSPGVRTEEQNIFIQAYIDAPPEYDHKKFQGYLQYVHQITVCSPLKYGPELPYIQLIQIP